MSLERKPDGTLVLSKDVDLPDPLDVLVVGGGPAGTAVAFRAKELGRSALVVDMDDILSRIRDYAKNKPILPNYGRGDRMKFPLGDELFNALHFEPLDKDDMHALWKRHYYDFAVPAKVGVELTGLERDDDADLWIATLRNSNLKEEEQVRARAVVLAMGRGVPRRFDIPGDLDDLAFRFTDADLYVDGPALVVGGGTSAAEAVIAISNAKIAAGAPGDVYWSYRGTKLPKVSAALAEPFFEAYVQNGNVRYHPLSEPQAVLLGDDKDAYLSIRVDRREVTGRPAEALHLEFPVERCVACIGEDIPVGLLTDLGLKPRVGGRRKAKRLTVSPILETQRRNLYLIGDTLSDSYMETTDFTADPKSFADRQRPGNIKMALRDGLVAMEVIHQRLDGKGDVEVEIRWAKDSPEDKTMAPFLITPAGGVEAPPAPGSAPVPTPAAIPVPTGDAAQKDHSQQIPAVGAGGKASGSTASPADAATGPGESAGAGGAGAGPGGTSGVDEAPSAPAYLVRVLPGNVEEDEFPLHEGQNATIGRSGATITGADDSQLAELHATVIREGGRFTLRDDGGATGVFLRLKPGVETEVPDGTVLRAGRQFVRLNGKRLEHLADDGSVRGSHDLSGEHAFVGRKDTDFVLDAGDSTLSRRHLSVALRDGTRFVTDHFSANGTWRRIEGACPLEDGDEFRAGRQVFRLRTPASADADLAGESAGDKDRSVLVSTARPSDAAGAGARARADAGAAGSNAAGSAAPGSGPAASAPAPGAAPGPAPAADGPTQVAFAGQDAPFEADEGMSVLEVAQENEIPIEYECQGGSCGFDPVRVTAGMENLEPAGEVEAKYLKEKGHGPDCRFACMAFLTGGPVEVEVLKRKA